MEVKDSIANVTTIGAAGAAMIDWDATLTIILILTGIALNVTRIYELYRKRKEDTEN